MDVDLCGEVTRWSQGGHFLLGFELICVGACHLVEIFWCTFVLVNFGEDPSGDQGLVLALEWLLVCLFVVCQLTFSIF